MTAIVVICIIVLLFAFLLNIKIRAEIKYRGGVADIKVKYFFFTIFPFKEKAEKPEKPQKRRSEKKKRGSEKESAAADKSGNASENVAENGSDADSEGSDSVSEEADSGGEKLKKDKSKGKKSFSERFGGIGDIIEKVKIIWGFTQKGLKKLFVHIGISDLVIDFSIAGEDAYNTALNYGRICAVTYNAIGFIQVLFRTSVKSVDIVCDFNGKKSVYDCEAKITITPSTILSAAFILLFGFLRNYGKIMGKPKSKKQPDSKEAVTV